MPAPRFESAPETATPMKNKTKLIAVTHVAIESKETCARARDLLIARSWVAGAELSALTSRMIRMSMSGLRTARWKGLDGVKTNSARKSRWIRRAGMANSWLVLTVGAHG